MLNSQLGQVKINKTLFKHFFPHFQVINFGLIRIYFLIGRRPSRRLEKICSFIHSNSAKMTSLSTLEFNSRQGKIPLLWFTADHIIEKSCEDILKQEDFFRNQTKLCNTFGVTIENYRSRQPNFTPYHGFFFYQVLCYTCLFI